MRTRAQILQDIENLRQRMEAFNAEHSANWTDERAAEWTAFETQMRGLDAELQRREDLDTRATRAAQLQQPEPRTALVSPGDGQVPAVHVDGRAAGTPDCPYQNIGAFLADVRFNNTRPELRMYQPGTREFQRAFSMETGAEGGYLIPPQFSSQLLAISPESEIVYPLAQVIPAGSAPDADITFPALKQGANGVFGGVTVTWTGEGATMTETDADLEEVSLKPKEVTAYITVTNKLLRNSDAASAIISRLLRDGIVSARDYAFLRGNGVGKPLGLLNSAGRKNVTRTGASAVVLADVLAMRAAILPESAGRAVWVANQSILPSIYTLKDEEGNNIFLRGDATKGGADTLLGMPIKWTGRTPALGTAGDLMLADFSYYLIKEGFGPVISMSEHVNFTSNKTVIKVVMSVDGEGWVREALKLEDGVTTVSPYVVLN